MRAALALLLALWCGHAAAQPLCPGSNQSWSFTLQPPQQFAVYDLTNTAPGTTGGPPGQLVGLATVLWLSAPLSTAFVGIPQTVAQQWQTASNTMTFYQQRILPAYHSILLYQGQPYMNCPFRGPAGYVLWTR
jgi:hypothetical protein